MKTWVDGNSPTQGSTTHSLLLQMQTLV